MPGHRFYFAEKKNKKTAGEKIRLLSEHLFIAAVTETTARKATKHSSVHEFEDRLEYYSALENKCECMITEDVSDFYFSEIEAISGEKFFEKYLKIRH